MAKRFKKSLAIAIAIIMVFAMVIPVAGAATMNRVTGQNSVFLGINAPEFVVFSDGQIGSQPGTGVVVWTPSGSGDWDAIKAAIIAAGSAPGWLSNNNYYFLGFFGGSSGNVFDGGQNHTFSVENTSDGWFATKRDLSGNLSGSISNTIFYGDINANQPQYGALEVTVDAEQKVVTVTEVAIMQRVITPTQTVTQYVSQNFSSVTATTPAQWALRSCPNVINVRNGNPIHPNGNNGGYNPLVVRNANHFVYASLPYAELAAGNEVDLVLVVGNNFRQVGNATVTYTNGYLTITFEYGLFSGSWGAVSFNNMRGVPNNGNIHSIGGNHGPRDMANIGASASRFSHDINTNTVTIPAASPTAAGYVYLYIHGTFTFDLGRVYGEIVNVVNYVQVGSETVESYVINTVNTNDALIVVYDSYGYEVARANGSLNANLPIGYYTVIITFEGQTVSEMALVVANETTSVNGSFTLPTLTLYETDEYWLPDYIADLVITTVIVRR